MSISPIHTALAMMSRVPDRRVSAMGGEGLLTARSDTCFTNAPPVSASASSRSTSQHTYCTSNGAIMPSRKAYVARLSKMYNVTLFIGFTSQLICPLHSKTRAFLAHLNIRISELGKTNHQQYNSDSSHAQEVGPLHAEEDRFAHPSA